jgi:hypothetical protein
MGRKNWTFAGSDEGGHRAAAIYTLIQTANLNDVDPYAWLADVPASLNLGWVWSLPTAEMLLSSPAAGL